MPITRQDAKKLLECYTWREHLQQQKERIMRTDIKTFEAHVHGIPTGGPSDHIFTVTREQLITSVEIKQKGVDEEIVKLGGQI